MLISEVCKWIRVRLAASVRIRDRHRENQLVGVGVILG